MVVVSGQALSVGSPRHPNTFNLNHTPEEDPLKISFGLAGPGQPEIWSNNRGDGVIEVSYRVGLVGQYKIHIKYDGEHIEGSPFNLTMR